MKSVKSYKLDSELLKELRELKKDVKQKEEIQREILNLVTDTNKKLYSDDWEPKQNIRQKMYEVSREETAKYVLKNMLKARAFNYTLDILTFAVSESKIDGLFLEFGVFSGKTINHIARLLPDEVIYGFDSFEGLPETWRSGYEVGTFKVDGVPSVEQNVILVKGLFQDTLSVFKTQQLETCAFIHIDCDLYFSTVCVLEELKDRIIEGTIIVFDEYFNYPDWKNGEFKAFQEFVNKYNLKYEYIAYVEILEQVAVRIIS